MKKTKKTQRMSDAAVKAKTGKVWAEWLKILDAAGAKKLTHAEIAAHLYEKRKLPGWWAQMVAVGYEQARGLRVVHQASDGFAANGSRTVAAGLARLYRTWANEKARRDWLEDSRIAIRTARPGKSLRLAWDGGKSRVEVMFYGKGKVKSQVTVDHRRLANAREASRMKTYWAEALDRMKASLES